MMVLLLLGCAGGPVLMVLLVVRTMARQMVLVVLVVWCAAHGEVVSLAVILAITRLVDRGDPLRHQHVRQ